MSGSAANASARRRRAASTSDIQDNVERQPVSVANKQTKMSEPLALLYNHEEKLRELDEFDGELVDKMNNQEQFNSSIVRKIKDIEGTINESLKSNDTDENNKKMDDILKINKDYSLRIEEMLKEINVLKLMIIKSQALSLDSLNKTIKTIKTREDDTEDNSI